MQESSAMEWVDEARRSLGKGDLSRARHLLRRALPGISDEPEALAMAGLLLFRLGSVHAAVSCVRRSVRLDPDSFRGASAAFNVLWLAGLWAEAAEHAICWASHSDSNAEQTLQVVGVLESVGLEQEASEMVGHGLRCFAESGGQFLESGLHLASESDYCDPIPYLLRRLSQGSVMDQVIGAEWALKLGEVETLHSILEQLSPDDCPWLRAHLSLWKGEGKDFSRGLETAKVKEPDEARQCQLQGRMLCLEGDWSEGIRVLQSGTPNAEDELWIVEGLRKAGRFDEAWVALQQMERRWGSLPLAGRLNQILVDFELKDLDGHFKVDATEYQGVVTGLLCLFPQWDGKWNGRVGSLRHLFEHALERFGGNRSRKQTFLSPDGTLQLVEDEFLATNVRFEWVLRRLCVRTFAALDEELAAFGETASGLAARAELSLRHGRHQEARQRLLALGDSAPTELWLELALKEGDHEGIQSCLKQGVSSSLMKAHGAWVLGQTDPFHGFLEEVKDEKETTSLRYALLKVLDASQPGQALTNLRTRFPVLWSVLGSKEDSADLALDAVKAGLATLVTGVITATETLHVEEDYLRAVLERPEKMRVG